MNDYSDNESDISLHELCSHNLGSENNTRHLNDQERDHERVRIEQRFNDMNRQIEELTSLVRTLPEKIASNHREENDKNVKQTGTPCHSDTVMSHLWYLSTYGSFLYNTPFSSSYTNSGSETSTHPFSKEKSHTLTSTINNSSLQL